MSNTEMISNFWTFISKRLDAEAPLADWRLLVGKGIDFEKLQRQYLVSTGKSANLITCPKPCSPACGFRKVCEYDGEYEAVCREWPLKSYPIKAVDAQIFTVNTRAIVPELVRIFQIRSRPSVFNNEADTWQLGEVSLPGGKSATVYFTLKIWDHEVTDLIYRINCKENRPYVLLVTARKVIHPTSDAILKDMGAVFVPLNEVTDFTAEAELRLIQECNLPYLISPPVAHPEPEPDNIFRKCGDAWEVRFAGGEKFMLMEVDLGANYIHLLLQSPHKGISVLTATAVPGSAIGAEQRDEFNTGFSIISHPDENGIRVADPSAIRQYREEERELHLEMDEARQSGDNVWLEQMENDLLQIRTAIEEAVSPVGQYKSLNDPIKNASNSLRNAVNRAIHKIEKHDRSLASHLKAYIRFGQNAIYQPPEPIDWAL